MSKIAHIAVVSSAGTPPSSAARASTSQEKNKSDSSLLRASDTNNFQREKYCGEVRAFYVMKSLRKKSNEFGYEIKLFVKTQGET